MPFWGQDGLATKRKSSCWKQFFVAEWSEGYEAIPNRVILLLEVSKWGRLRSSECPTATHLRVGFLARSPERENWAPFLTLTLRDSQIWDIRFDRWMPWNEKWPLFLTLDLVEDMIWGVKLGCRPGRGYNLGGQIRVSTWSRIWFEGSNWTSDLPEEQFGGSNWTTDLPEG